MAMGACLTSELFEFLEEMRHNKKPRLDIMLGAFEAIGPFMRFLTEAIGLPYRSATAERVRP